MGMNGSNHYLHIIGQQDAMHYTITVHVPNNGMPIIIESNRGIMNHSPGYGHQYGTFLFIQALKASYISPTIWTTAITIMGITITDITDTIDHSFIESIIFKLN